MTLCSAPSARACGRGASRESPGHGLEAALARVVAPECMDSEDLAGWCRRHLAPYKVPTGFARVERLPRSDIGKLLRRELSAGYRGS